MKRSTLAKVLVMLMVFSIFTVGCGKKEEKQEESYTPVEVSTAKKDEIYNYTVLTGKVEADKDVQIAPKTPGKVESVNVKVGDKVKAGTVLFTLDKSDLQKSLDMAKSGINQARAGLDSARGGVNTAKAAYDAAKANYNSNYEKIQNAKVNLKRMEELYKEGIISKADLEKAQLAASDSNVDALKAQLNQAEAAYNQSQSGIGNAQAAYEKAEVGYRQAQDVLKDASVTSPIDGIVASVNVEKGEMASNMQPSITVVGVDKLYIKVDVSENLVTKLNKGDSVKIEVPSLEDKKAECKIDSISPAADEKTQLYSVKIAVGKIDGLKSGMFAKVKFKTDIKKDVIVVKSESIIQRDDKNIVYISKGKKAHEVKVELGLDNGDYVEIKSGLNQGDRVVTKGQDYLQNGTTVKEVRSDN
ncbi:multidrug resistance protein MdtN [Clostridium acetireducens DSM 10703]|jgi:multidrug efflux pump subunit AcrA (membrane-fusion protein)|uniref:Multidrug resistance protein MdtN n=1 Tax=Clostridium acetireducens DSM 10703 TaxID=1121290 RepID=A0A1E8F0S0_9CLOT|nr:efflux RND transporter periplasmic adaptor subunit [Clostridium acetireducens]OFI06750.1 multidrug resistance protein MdtN [Clostridium acetireducens DSM 10703]